MIKNIDRTKRLDFSLPAMRIHQREQDDKAIYMAKINAKELATRSEERFVIDVYKRVEGKEDSGYQRPVSDSAVQKIKNFILEDSKNPLLPTAILVNSRNPLDFKDSGGGIGKLTINDTLHIIDGQHRYDAWRSLMEDPDLQELLGDYELPLVILSGFKEYQEIEQFWVINSKQKRIKTDLAQRHLLALAAHEETKGLIPTGKQWELPATKVVDLLNEQIEGVWKKKIILADDKADLRKTKFVSQTSFVSSLQPLLSGSDPVLKWVDGIDNLGMWAKIISDYWDIIKRYYPHATKDKRDYSLMKTVGVFPFHIVLAKVLIKETNVAKALAEVEVIIKKASENGLGESFWKTNQSEYVKSMGRYAGAYSSSVGHVRIAQAIMFGEL